MTSAADYKVDVTRGARDGRVSSEWFSRPHDERFLSLGELAGAVRGRAERSRTRVVETALIHVEANRTDPERLSLILPGAEAPVAPTHWSFGQLAAQVGAPAAYLRNLPAALGRHQSAIWPDLEPGRTDQNAGNRRRPCRTARRHRPGLWPHL